MNSLCPSLLFACWAVGLATTGNCQSNHVQDPHWPKDNRGCTAYDPYPRAGLTIRWRGECKGGYAEGNGTLEWYKDDDRVQWLEGNFSRGYLNGHGSATSGRYSYSGEFKGSQWTGNGQVTFYPSGDLYKGEFKNGTPDGYGIMTHADGRVEEGTWGLVPEGGGVFGLLREWRAGAPPQTWTASSQVGTHSSQEASAKSKDAISTQELLQQINSVTIRSPDELRKFYEQFLSRGQDAEVIKHGDIATAAFDERRCWLSGSGIEQGSTVIRAQANVVERCDPNKDRAHWRFRAANERVFQKLTLDAGLLTASTSDGAQVRLNVLDGRASPASTEQTKQGNGQPGSSGGTTQTSGTPSSKGAASTSGDASTCWSSELDRINDPSVRAQLSVDNLVDQIIQTARGPNGLAALDDQIAQMQDVQGQATQHIRIAEEDIAATSASDSPSSVTATQCAAARSGGGGANMAALCERLNMENMQHFARGAIEVMQCVKGDLQ